MKKRMATKETIPNQKIRNLINLNPGKEEREEEVPFVWLLQRYRCKMFRCITTLEIGLSVY